MKYPPYPEYKQCNAQWLAHLPTHWNAKRLKIEATYCVSNVDKVAGENELPVRLCNYTDVYCNDYIHPDMDLMETTATVDEIRKFGLRVNDVVITKDSEEWSDIAIPAIVTKTAPDFVCGYHLAIIRPNADRLYGPFLLRLLQSSAVNQQFQIAASGVTRYGLPKSAIGEAWLPVPPVEEQEAIARFLDVKTAQIDTLVAKKRQLIEKLKEKRSALIARTVTRGLLLEVAKAAGLEPNPAMKDSGIEWIGDIPNHWITIPYKRLCSRVDVGIAEAATHAYCDDGVPIIRSKNVTPNGIDTSDLMYIEPWFAEKNKSKVLRGGDLVTVRTGYPGTTAVVPPELENCQCFTLVMSSVVRDVYLSVVT